MIHPITGRNIASSSRDITAAAAMTPTIVGGSMRRMYSHCACWRKAATAAMSPAISMGRSTPVESRAPNRNAKTITCSRPKPAKPDLLMPMPAAAIAASSH